MPEEEKKEGEGKGFFDIGPGKGYMRVYISTAKVLLNNFLGGLAWGFGTVLGATVVVALVLFMLSKLDTVPIIGDFINNILEEIQQGTGR